MTHGFVGFHLNNMAPPSPRDWSIIKRVRPGLITFLPWYGDVDQHTIGDILDIVPECHFMVRPYLPPAWLLEQGGSMARPNYAHAIPRYIDHCKRAMDTFDLIPAKQRHLQPYNEVNMPRSVEAWEGFGSQDHDMRQFDQIFVETVAALRAHNTAWPINWPALTIGNRDCQLDGDPHDVPYWMHGPLPQNPTDKDYAAAALSSPCKRSLDLADDYGAHVYLQYDPRAEIGAIWRGTRHKQYARFLRPDMPIYITEGGILAPGKMEPDVLISWLAATRDCLLRGRVRNVALWILGKSKKWGEFFGDDNVVAALAEFNFWNQVADDAPAVPPPSPPASAPPMVMTEALSLWLRQRIGTALAVDTNPAAALAKTAAKRNMGHALTDEIIVPRERLPTAQPVDLVVQAYTGGLVYCWRGHWDNVYAQSWPTSDLT